MFAALHIRTITEYNPIIRDFSLVKNPGSMANTSKFDTLHLNGILE